jgi:membrane-bound ClpP family serine protease
MHGVLAFVAGICTAIAILLFILGFSGIYYYGIPPQTQIAFAIIALSIAAITTWMLVSALQARKHKIETGKEALIGADGKAATDLNPDGTVRVNGEFWQATTKNGPIKSGDPVKVVDMEGMFLIVKPHEEKA